MPRRYKIEDEQWNRIKHLLPIAKTGCPAKWDNKIMFNDILWLALSRSGKIFLHDILHIRLCIADFVNVQRMVHSRKYSKSLEKMPTWKTSVLTPHVSKHIHKVRVQKRGSKFTIQTTHRKQSWWEKHQASCCCRCYWKPYPIPAFCRTSP